MFAKLTGKIDEVRARHAVLDVNGVGYLVACSSRTLSQLQGKEYVTLYVETQVREDAIALFGFLSAEEQDWFLLLTSVQGVGGKVALAIMSVLSPQDLTNAIISHDKKMISQADGVGPKLADRICNELKTKVGSFTSTEPSPALMAANSNVSSLAGDAISALVNLGYDRAHAYRVVQNQLQKAEGDASLPQLIQQGLRELSA